MSKAADFLVEVGTEELPPKALRKFASGIQDGLEKHRLGHSEIRAFASPRRLAVIVSALEDGQEDREVRRKGPPVSVAFDDKGQATKAALAFAKKCGAEVGDLEREKTDAGEWLSLTVREPGKSAACLVPDIVQHSLDALPIPRRMRWGAHAEEFVRPVHWLIMLHGTTVIPGAVLGIESSNQTRGHRFHTSGELEIGSPADYVSTLESPGYVIADFAVRREKIVGLVADAAKMAGGEAVGDDSLYDEVTALTEWPVSLTGSFDDDFLALPREVIIATLTNHQRYFPVADKQGALLPVFITLANLESKEPDRVRDGNERVIRPRLADAAFFWATDQQIALSDLLAEQLGVDGESATRAAVLAKCDLLTGMVGEFPELQGTMGAYYARAGDEADAVATAIGEHYLPRFAGDVLPASVDGQILALADKLDTLAGIFVLGKKPTGNRDPFGLRRSALGVIRILIENNLELDVVEAIKAAVVQQPASGEDHGSISESLHDFIVERLKSYFLDGTNDYTADMFEAVRVRQPASLPDFLERMRAVVVFLGLEQSVSLAAANKRTANILRQAKFSESESTLDATLLIDVAEQVLFHAMQSAKKDIAPLIRKRAYSDSLRRLAELRAPVDSFFDDVMVMTDDEATRNNRLALLAGLRDLFLGVADISRLTPAQE